MTQIQVCLLACTLLAFGSHVAGAQQAPPVFDHRKLIADNLAKLFSAEAKAHSIAISELRRVPSAAGLMWGTCVRVSATSMSGRPVPSRTYVVTFSRNIIAERRPAAEADCAGASYAPLS